MLLKCDPCRSAPLPSRSLKRWVGQMLPKGPTELAGMARVEVEAIDSSSDWIEGRDAFIEKRAPNFKGK